MSDETPLINILTYKLPFKLANQIYNEFQGRLREANYLIDKYKTYQVLQNNLDTVETLLSLSIFYKRVITNLDAAVKFYGTVSQKSDADTISIGSYKLTGLEKNKLLAVVLNYNQLIAKFSIPPYVMEYYETREFLKSVIDLKSNTENAQIKERKNNRDKDKED